MRRVLPLALVLAFCSVATAAPVLVTKDNYMSAADSPFDLAGGGFYLEDFEDGTVNTPGLSARTDPPPFDFYRSRIVGPLVGGVSVDPSGFAIRPDNVLSDLVAHNFTHLAFDFDDSVLGSLPKQVGFVLTQADIPGTVYIDLFRPNGSMIGTLTSDFASGRSLGVTSTEGIATIEVSMRAGTSDSPYFQVDHVQYVPEPSGAVLLLAGIAVVAGSRVRSNPRRLGMLAAIAAMVLATWLYELVVRFTLPAAQS